ncbi:helix-turn-helix domain-containing protein [Nonomuraea wenchangensis]
MNTAAERPRPVAVSDIADLLGVSVNTVNQWRKRAASAVKVTPFPPAEGKVAGIDYWWEDKILDWARLTERLKPAAPDRPSPDPE